MSARIIELSRFVAERSSSPAVASTASDIGASDSERFEFWTGQSGRRYVHTVFSLIECPELPSANYVLVRREPHGQRTALRVSRTVHASASLNLADIRHRGAQLGAQEVHVHLIAASDAARRLIERDIAGSVDAEDARVSA
jgi:hypothetical protein